MGIHQAGNSRLQPYGNSNGSDCRRETPRDDRFLNKNRQPDRSSRTDTGPQHSPSVQSEAPIALMYSNVSGSSVYVLTLQIVAAAP